MADILITIITFIQQKVNKMKDLGATFETELCSSFLSEEKLNKVFCMGMIKINFIYLTWHAFASLDKSLAKCHLEYANS